MNNAKLIDDFMRLRLPGKPLKLTITKIEKLNEDGTKERII